MKPFYKFSFALAFCAVFVFLSSCDHKSTSGGDPVPQLSGGDCSHLSPFDLDLSSGFIGTAVKNHDPDLADFTLKDTWTSYEFPSQAPDDTCSGYCALTVHFEDADDGTTVIWNDLVLEEVNLSYYDQGGTLVEASVQNYSWSAPDLIIQDLIAETFVDYDISFVNSTGELVEIAEVTVAGGLCIVDNVNNTDPVAVPISRDPGSEQDD